MFVSFQTPLRFVFVLFGVPFASLVEAIRFASGVRPAANTCVAAGAGSPAGPPDTGVPGAEDAGA